jgi:transcriptional regulator with XRE-family HTH domain
MWQSSAVGENLQDVLSGVGPRLRALRKRRGTTLEQLAADTGISVSTLSWLESGRRRPTLELLLPLAGAHQVQLDELVGAPATGDPRVHPRAFRRNGSTWVQLAHNPGGLNAFKQILPVGSPNRPRDLCRHDGYEWVYVLSGKLQLFLGEEEYVLAAGEAAEFDTRVPHGYANGGTIPLELILLIGDQGSRVHLRVRTSRRPSGVPCVPGGEAPAVVRGTRRRPGTER